MDLRPWNYWTRDGQPYEETAEILRLLESVLERNPNHPGAIHYYIHSVELVHPELAEAGADRLRKLVPGAGHLVHMPSHIYRRVGRYADASASNVQAIAADEDYIAQCRAQGIYPVGYYPHNIHFLWDSATMEGRKQVAVEAARKVGSKATPEVLGELPMLTTFAVVPLYAYVRFGLWEEILQEPQPPADNQFWIGVWHYARGVAFTATERLEEAATELESLEKLAADKALEDFQLFSPNSAAAVLRIAAATLAGELAAKQGDLEKAIAQLHRGVLLQDALVYIEPPDWHYPVRQSLGAVLLEAGRPVEAEVVYWEDLKRNPENGWSLFGLMQALRAQGKNEQVATIEKRFQKAWAQADVELTASRF
jgi:tetratricopeptide (TPR) repeat protein